MLKVMVKENICENLFKVCMLASLRAVCKAFILFSLR